MSRETWKWLCTLSAHQTWLSFFTFFCQEGWEITFNKIWGWLSCQDFLQQQSTNAKVGILANQPFHYFSYIYTIPKDLFLFEYGWVLCADRQENKINSIHFRLVWKCGKCATAWKLCLNLTVQRIYKVIIQTKLKPSNKCKSFFSRNEHWNHKNTIKPMINS